MSKKNQELSQTKSSLADEKKAKNQLEDKNFQLTRQLHQTMSKLAENQEIKGLEIAHLKDK